MYRLACSGAILILLVFCIGRTSAGAEILRLDVSRTNDDYQLVLEARLAARREPVWAVLTDYPELQALSDTVRSSEVIAYTDDAGALVRTELHVCILIFCRDLVQVQQMQVAAPFVLTASTPAGESDFEFNNAAWILSEENGGTHLFFTASFRPAFWVPPVIGPWAIERDLISDARFTAQQLERRAQSR